MSTQQIRSTQMVTTYGPGAIVEAPGGPGVMRAIATSGVLGDERPADYEITDIRLSRRLQGARLFRVPTNAERSRPDNDGIYTANAFPGWSMCAVHGIIYQYRDGIGGCPRCSPSVDGWSARARARAQATRFVRVCREGHLDDLDWPRLFRHKRAGCAPSYLHWLGGAGALPSILLECPECGARISMEQVYLQTYPCMGRLPEQERGSVQRPGCTERAHVLQRNATNLRIAEVATSLTIPKIDDQLHYVLAVPTVAATILTGRPGSKDDLLALLRPLAAAGVVPSSTVNHVEGCDAQEVLAALQDVIGVYEAQPDADDFRLDELAQLERAALHGAPPADRLSRDPTDFEVILGSTREYAGPKGRSIRITPVSKLRVTLAQRGYRRIDPDPTKSRLQETHWFDQDQRWLMAVANRGEGLFVSLPEPNLDVTGTRAEDWSRRHRELVGGSQYVMGELGPEVAHPLLVWWHTLSHRLMTALSLDSGYSSAALRERLYVNLDPAKGPIRGGILIYTSQPGGDGTLGGLVDTAQRFDEVIARALGGLSECSNDPVCLSQSVSSHTLNGAACYACQFVSETSCEARNLGLDRGLLIENPL